MRPPSRTRDQAQAQSSLLGQTLGQGRRLHAAVRHSGSWGRCRLRCRGRSRRGCGGRCGSWRRRRNGCWGRRWSRCCRRFLCRGLSLCRGEQLSNVLALLTKHTKHAVHRSRVALFHANVQQHTVLERFELHGGFVGFDFGKQLAAFHLVTNVFVPLSDDPFGHGVAQFGHANDFSHVSRSQKGNQIACRRLRIALKRREAGSLPQT